MSRSSKASVWFNLSYDTWEDGAEHNSHVQRLHYPQTSAEQSRPRYLCERHCWNFVADVELPLHFLRKERESIQQRCVDLSGCGEKHISGFSRQWQHSQRASGTVPFPVCPGLLFLTLLPHISTGTSISEEKTVEASSAHKDTGSMDAST